METGARVVLGGFVAIVLLHWMSSGPKTNNAALWLNYVFTGRGGGVRQNVSTTTTPKGPVYV